MAKFVIGQMVRRRGDAFRVLSDGTREEMNYLGRVLSVNVLPLGNSPGWTRYVVVGEDGRKRTFMEGDLEPAE